MEYYQVQGDTVNYQSYYVLLKDKLKPAIHTKRWRMLSKNVLPCHPHTALATRETIAESKFGALPDPAYGSDLVPCDFHVFGPLKDDL